VLALSDQKKRLGDKIAKTVVLVNRNKPKRLPQVLALACIAITFFMFVFFVVGSTLKNSDAYKVATSEIERNEQIVTETGGIKGYGMIPGGNLSISNGHGRAHLEIKVLGNTKDLNVSVNLEKEPNGQWKLIEISK
jgi:hypothetical protein